MTSHVADVFFLMGLWSDADHVDDSKYSTTTSAQNCFTLVQAGWEDGRLEGQDESGIVVALDSLDHKGCSP